jgi:ATP-binding cassette subfamily F protein uup
LMRLLMTEPNVLILDEPTNDLDIETLTALEDLLDGWPGVLLVVSHDRYFLERVTDRAVALFGDGTLLELPGGVDEYLARRRAMAMPDVAAAPVTKRAVAVDSRAAKKELARLERQLSRLDKREAELHALMAEHATDYERVAGYDAELRSVLAEKSSTEESWLELSTELEAG